MVEELKACPFCGCVAEADAQQSYRNITTGNLERACAVYCTSCSANLSLCRADLPDMTGDELMRMVIENWNTRHTEQPTGEA